MTKSLFSTTLCAPFVSVVVYGRPEIKTFSRKSMEDHRSKNHGMQSFQSFLSMIGCALEDIGHDSS